MTPQRLAEIKARCEAAHGMIDLSVLKHVMVPDLVEEVERLQAYIHQKEADCALWREPYETVWAERESTRNALRLVEEERDRLRDAFQVASAQCGSMDAELTRLRGKIGDSNGVDVHVG